MKYLKSYNKINEGLRDKMLPKPKEEIMASIKKTLGVDNDYIQVKLPEPKEIKKIIKIVEISDEYNVDIKDYKDDNVIICGNIVDVFNFMQFYLNYTLMNKRNSKTFHIDYIKDNIINNLNEGLRDKMLAKPDEEILQYIDNLSIPEKLQKYIEYGYDELAINIIDNENIPIETLNGLLILCAIHNKLDIIKLLIKKGANVKYNNNEALVWACTKGNLDIVKYLVENGAYIFAQKEFTIVNSIINNHPKVVEYLLQSNNYNKLDYYEFLKIALRHNHKEIAELIRSYL